MDDTIDTENEENRLVGLTVKKRVVHETKSKRERYRQQRKLEEEDGFGRVATYRLLYLIYILMK